MEDTGKADGAVERRLTKAGMDLLPEEIRRPVEAALARGGREAYVVARGDGGVFVEVRNVKP